MSDTLQSLRRKMDGARDLRSVVHTMKALAAASITQYEKAVQSLADYYRTVELGLAASFRESAPGITGEAHGGGTGAIVFGSDQGLVGQFNETLADYVTTTLGKMPGHHTVWAIGERMQLRLADAGHAPTASFNVPHSVKAITPLIGQILIATEARRAEGKLAQVYLFHNRTSSPGVYGPVHQRLLPLDETWRRKLSAIAWPTTQLPEVVYRGESTLMAFVREYLFVSLFQACAESLASENASRLSAMQRADKNIGELLDDFGQTFNRMRQSSIDEELFDLVSGFEALAKGGTHPQ